MQSADPAAHSTPRPQPGPPADPVEPAPGSVSANAPGVPEATGRVRRLLHVIGRLLPFLLAFLRDRRRWILFGASRQLSEEAHRERARRIVATIAALGPTFIKLTQVLSSRADIIAEPYLSELGRLQDEVSPAPFDAIARVIESEYGRPVDSVFDDFERTPIATASLGQVHRARVGSREVAVKVLRPGVRAVVALDLDVSFRVLFLLNVLFPNHHVRALTSVVREFERRIGEEMDMREEAANTRWFSEQFADAAGVRAPEVLTELVRPRVLVTEYLRGTKVDRLQDLFARGQLSFPEMIDRLGETYIRMMLIDGVIHADPHPGNILVQDDGTVVFLDFGMVVRIQKPTRERLFRLALAAAREDVDAIINLMYEMGMIDPDIGRAEVRDAAVRVMEILETARHTSNRRIQEMVEEVLDTFYRWPLILPEELVYFFRALVLLEGIGIRYDPAFNGLDVAKPVINRMRKELLSASGADMGSMARDVVGEVEHTARGLAALVRRAEREEFRIRFHPRDVHDMERLAQLLVRRLLLGLFAAVLAIVSTLIFVAVGSWVVLLLGNAIAIFLFFLVLFIPKHLLTNPLRHAMHWRRSGGR